MSKTIVEGVDHVGKPRLTMVTSPDFIFQIRIADYKSGYSPFGFRILNPDFVF
jgi:hypothetical protein